MLNTAGGSEYRQDSWGKQKNATDRREADIIDGISLVSKKRREKGEKKWEQSANNGISQPRLLSTHALPKSYRFREAFKRKGRTAKKGGEFKGRRSGAVSVKRATRFESSGTTTERQPGATATACGSVRRSPASVRSSASPTCWRTWPLGSITVSRPERVSIFSDFSAGMPTASSAAIAQIGRGSNQTGLWVRLVLSEVPLQRHRQNALRRLPSACSPGTSGNQKQALGRASTRRWSWSSRRADREWLWARRLAQHCAASCDRRPRGSRCRPISLKRHMSVQHVPWVTDHRRGAIDYVPWARGYGLRAIGEGS